IVPKVALVSHSSFGSSTDPQARKMQLALSLINAQEPDLEVEGEMQGDAALSEKIRRSAFPDARLKGDANLLIMPTLDAANISFNLLRVPPGRGRTLGRILLGVAKPIHILTPSATVRRIVNMTALAVVDAGVDRQRALICPCGDRGLVALRCKNYTPVRHLCRNRFRGANRARADAGRHDSCCV